MLGVLECWKSYNVGSPGMFGILQCVEFRNVGRPGMVGILMLGILESWET